MDTMKSNEAESIRKNELKPNGQPFGTFLVSIDDGYVECVYTIRPRCKNPTIDMIYKKLRKALRLRETRPEVRVRY